MKEVSFNDNIQGVEVACSTKILPAIEHKVATELSPEYHEGRPQLKQITLVAQCPMDIPDKRFRAMAAMCLNDLMKQAKGGPGPINLTEGPVRKGGQNPPNQSTDRPSAPKGSGD